MQMPAFLRARKPWKQLVARAPCRPRGAGTVYGRARGALRGALACSSSSLAVDAIFLGEEVKIPMLCELLLNPIENPALFVTAGGSKNGSLTFTFFILCTTRLLATQ